jgi:hypothetical protein
MKPRDFAIGRIPATHFLEVWSDLRAYEGDGDDRTNRWIEAALRGISVHDNAFEALIGNCGPSAYDLVRATWQAGIVRGARILRRNGGRC